MYNRIATSTAVCLVAAAALFAPSRVGAEEIAPPPAPTIPHTIPFADQADGRHLLFGAYDAYHDAPRLNVSAHWETERADGSDRTSGTETLLTQAESGRLAITSETAEPRRSIRRTIATGGTLLTTSYEATTPTPKRQFFRLPIDEGVSTFQVVAQARFNPTTRVGEFVLSPDWLPRNAAQIYQSRPESTNENGVVIVVDQPTGNRENPTIVTHRYTIRTATHRIIRYEQWTTIPMPPQPPTPPGKRAHPRPPRSLYHREDYTEASPAAIPADAFSQNLPDGYQEQPIPGGNAPTAPNKPSEADPTALALYRRWRMAGMRFLSLSAEGTLMTRSDPRTEASRSLVRQNTAAQFVVWMQRPGKARLTLTYPTAPEKPTLVVADGSQVRGINYATRENRTEDVPNNPWASLWPRIRQVSGQQLEDDQLGWLLGNLPDVESFDKVALDRPGPQDLPGTTAVLLLTRSVKAEGGRGRIFTSTVTWRVCLGSDNLPREIAARRQTDIAGAMERDQPPIQSGDLRVVRLSADTEPSSNNFVLPALPK